MAIHGCAARRIAASVVSPLVGSLGLAGATIAVTREGTRPPTQSIAVIDSSPVTAAYFGLHVHRAVALAHGEPESAWPRMEGWSWRLWDARVAWKDLEPRRNEYDFARLDSLCARARASHVHLLLTLGLTPTWASSRPSEASSYEPGNQAPPTDIDDWRRYVDTLAKRYRGTIEAYEVWNEPNLRGFFSGTPAQLVELSRVAYTAVKAADPHAIVVTPSATGVPGGASWLKEYLSAGGDAYGDVVGFHFYVTPRDPEEMLAAIDTVRAVLAETKLHSAPLWNTESGWLLQNHDVAVQPRGPVGSFGSRVLDDTTGAAFVARALVLGRCGSLARFYWYAWDNRRMGLLDADGQHRKLEAGAYETIRTWLLGARVTSCSASPNGVWTVRILRGTSRAMIVWSTRGTQLYETRSGEQRIARWPLLALREMRDDNRRPLVATAVPTLIRYGEAPPNR